MKSVGSKVQVFAFVAIVTSLILIARIWSSSLLDYYSDFSAINNTFDQANPLPLVSRLVNGKARYIGNLLVDDGPSCFGLGNWLFRFASIYGIGLKFNRFPFFSFNNTCARSMISELHRVFPEMKTVLSGQLPTDNETKWTDYGWYSFKFDHFSQMHDTREKYLMINGTYLQTYKYFHHARPSIRKLFEFNRKTRMEVDLYARMLFDTEPVPSHRLCIHTRRSDFLEHRNLESRVDFIIIALDLLFDTLKSSKPYSVVIFGDDFDFMENIKLNSERFPRIYIPDLPARTDDIYFATMNCDSFLITASGSTFAWWIAYLLPDDVSVFYNAQVSKNRTHGKELFDFDYFPPEWQKIEYFHINQTAVIDNRWHYEKFGVFYPLFDLVL